VTRATISIEDATQNERDACSTQVLDNEIRFEQLLVENMHRMAALEEVARRRGLLSPLSSRALGKAARGEINLSQSEKNALRHLFDRLDKSGVTPENWMTEASL
jgi:hypothetical protein